MEEQKYYRLNNILKCDAEYNMLLGERSNGKSYSVKECILWEAFNHADYEKWINEGVRVEKANNRYDFGYLRRWREETKTRDVESYFDDIDIKTLTSNVYDCVVVYRNDIFFGKTDAEGHIEKSENRIGCCFALTSATHYKSLAFPTIGNIVFEEFITNSGYLPREVDNLLDIVSSIARRNRVRVFLIGNTISRMCPYFDEWELVHVKTQKQGTIDIYNQPTNQTDPETGELITIKIAVEYCENSGNNSKMFFGNKANMIVSGVWESEIQPHLEGNFKEYTMCYKILYKYSSFKFYICLLRKGHEYPFLFVYPVGDDEDKKVKRVISDEFSTDKYTTLYLTKVAKFDSIVIELLKDRKVCFSDNLTGTEFFQIEKERGKF